MVKGIENIATKADLAKLLEQLKAKNRKMTRWFIVVGLLQTASTPVILYLLLK